MGEILANLNTKRRVSNSAKTTEPTIGTNRTVGSVD